MWQSGTNFPRRGVGGEARSPWPSDVGPDRRYYRLTAKGVGLLRKFTERNILIFQRQEVQQRLEALFMAEEA